MISNWLECLPSCFESLKSLDDYRHSRKNEYCGYTVANHFIIFRALYPLLSYQCNETFLKAEEKENKGIFWVTAVPWIYESAQLPRFFLSWIRARQPSLILWPYHLHGGFPSECFDLRAFDSSSNFGNSDVAWNLQMICIIIHGLSDETNCPFREIPQKTCDSLSSRIKQKRKREALFLSAKSGDIFSVHARTKKVYIICAHFLFLVPGSRKASPSVYTGGRRRPVPSTTSIVNEETNSKNQS